MKRNKIIVLLGSLQFLAINCLAQNVGINISNPAENFHMQNGNFLITGPFFVGSEKANISHTAAGTKFLWISNRSALRAGRLIGNEWQADSIGAQSFAFGSNVNASGNATAVFGASNRGVGFYAFAAGVNNLAIGDNAIAFGQNNLVEGRGGSLVAGEYNVSNSYAATVVGRYNDFSAMTSPNNAGADNPLFVVGNGTSNNQRSNALTVAANGRVGIGLSNPGATLDIIGPSFLQQLRLRSTTNDFVRIRMFNAVNTVPFWDIASITDPNSNPNAFMNFFYSRTGGTGMNVLSLQGNGNATLAGTLTQNSDARLKKEIEMLDNVLPLLQGIHGYSYKWKDEWRDQAVQTGLLAQEVEKVFPGLVKEDDDGIKSINYNGMVPYLLEAIKELKAEVEALKAKK